MRTKVCVDLFRLLTEDHACTAYELVEVADKAANWLFETDDASDQALRLQLLRLGVDHYGPYVEIGEAIKFAKVLYAWTIKRGE